MSPHAFALILTDRALATKPAAPRLHKLLALQTYLRDELQARCATALTPEQPAEGAPIEVRWCKAGTPGEVGEVWYPGTYRGTVGHGPGKQYMVSCTTPRRTSPITVPVAPESVRFLSQGAA